MRLGINLLPYTPGQHGGAEVYIRNLLNALSDVAHSTSIVLFVTPRGQGRYVSSGNHSFQECVLPAWSARSRLMRIIAEQSLMPWYVKRTKIDCLFSNYVIPLLAPVPQIVNVHDMLYKKLPKVLENTKQLYWSIFVPLSLRRATRVITVSHSSATDIVSYFPHVKDKLSVTVEGVNNELVKFRDVQPCIVAKELEIQAPFILSAATFGPHKNVRTLVEAFAIVSRQNPELRLVLTGGANTTDAQEERATLIGLINELGLTDRVVFTGYVSERLLAALYRCATLYIIPSLYEGFGLSVIEAQYFGTPVITSDTPALVEVGGDATISVPALDVKAFAAAILRLLTDEHERKQLIKQGRANVERYSWANAAQDVLQACSEVVSK